MLSGDNSILQRTTDAKERTGEAQIKEEIGLAWNGVQVEGIVNSWDINKKSEELQKELQKQDSSASTTVSENNIEITYKGYETTISYETGTIINFAKSKITINLTRTGTPVTQAEVLANIPQGFHYVGGKINEGIVISDVENDSMTPADSTGNQFVFVPVEKNQAIKLDVNSEEDIQSIILYNPFGKKIINLANQGKNYSTTISAINTDGETANEDIINGVYKAVVITENETKNLTLEVRSLYARDSFKNVCIDDEYFLSDEWFNIARPYYGNPETRQDLYLRMGGYTTDEQFIEASKQIWFSPIKSDFEETENKIKSVNTNGGFYIGRYETTKNGNSATSKKALLNGTANGSASLEDGMVWNYISQVDALEKAKAFNSKCSLLTGSAWDRTLGWIVETKSKTLEQVGLDSTEWGNYSYSTIIKTGEDETTKSNNIYDLSGNISEWTSESCNTSQKVFRGSSYQNPSADRYASLRGFVESSYTNNIVGFRLALYL